MGSSVRVRVCDSLTCSFSLIKKPFFPTSYWLHKEVVWRWNSFSHSLSICSLLTLCWVLKLGARGQEPIPLSSHCSLVCNRTRVGSAVQDRAGSEKTAPTVLVLEKVWMISEESLILGASNFYHIFIFTADTTLYIWNFKLGSGVAPMLLFSLIASFVSSCMWLTCFRLVLVCFWISIPTL